MLSQTLDSFDSRQLSSTLVTSPHNTTDKPIFLNLLRFLVLITLECVLTAQHLLWQPNKRRDASPGPASPVANGQSAAHASFYYPPISDGHLSLADAPYLVSEAALCGRRIRAVHCGLPFVIADFVIARDLSNSTGRLFCSPFFHLFSFSFFFKKKPTIDSPVTPSVKAVLALSKSQGHADHGATGLNMMPNAWQDIVWSGNDVIF